MLESGCTPRWEFSRVALLAVGKNSGECTEGASESSYGRRGESPGRQPRTVNLESEAKKTTQPLAELASYLPQSLAHLRHKKMTA